VNARAFSSSRNASNNPFLFLGRVCRAMVRPSNSPCADVTSGCGKTGFFVMDAAV